MVKKMSLPCVVLVGVCLYGLDAWALDPMGPPVPGFKLTYSSTGVEYSYSKMDLKATDGSTQISDVEGSVDLSDLDIKCETNKIYANLGFAVTRDWEIFLRLGVADADGEDKLLGMEGKFDSDMGFAIGVGTRATFFERDNLKFGGLAQVSLSKPDSHTGAGSGVLLAGDESYSYSGTEEIDIEFYEIQFAVGPIYRLRERVSVYGGPFLHLLYGSLDGSAEGTVEGGTGTLDYSYDLEEGAILGGYIGAQIDITENSLFNIEYQNTGDAYALCINLTRGFR